MHHGQFALGLLLLSLAMANRSCAPSSTIVCPPGPTCTLRHSRDLPMSRRAHARERESAISELHAQAIRTPEIPRF